MCQERQRSIVGMCISSTHAEIESKVSARKLPSKKTVSNVRSECPQTPPVVYHHVHKISFNCVFCAGVKLDGNLIEVPTIKSPLSSGFLLFGMPRFGYRSMKVGPVGPDPPTLICLPSMVLTVRFQPVNASFRSISTLCRRSSPSLLYNGCGFCDKN